jgi:mono/diheme cytochrome c family protein
MSKRIPAARALAFLAALSGAGLALAQEAGRSAAAGAYTDAQVERGAQAYSAQCAICHGADMRGSPGAPALSGPEFMFGWNSRTAGELLDYVRKNMPPGQAGSLSDQDYADVVAGILKANGFPAGPAELPAEVDAARSISLSKAP